MTAHALFAACLPGLEPLLAAELQALGAESKPLAGGVAFAGDARLAAAACLWLGTASHVLLRCAEFPCRALGELERKTALLPWTNWLRPGVPVTVTASARGSRVYHTGAIEERVLRAVNKALGGARASGRIAERRVERTREDAGHEPHEPHVHLAVRFHADVCTISLDTAPTPLHRRGYRLQTAKAPLREDLAHALVLAAAVPADAAFLDPFCGSGTIAIEHAALRLGLAPGRLRPPPFRDTALFDAASWREVAAAPHPAAKPEAPDAVRPRIAASDRDAGAVEAARANAERAGVAAAIDFRVTALAAHPWLEGPGNAPTSGVVVTNPPFGMRAKGGPGLLPLYQTLGHRVRRLGASWRLALLAHDVRLARRTGTPLRTAFTTKTGGLSVTALVQ